MKKIIILIAFAAFTFRGYAQDPHFSQYNNARLYTNPAFAGTDSTLVIAANGRLQWPNINSPYESMNFSADKYIRAIRGGVGINYLYDYEAKGAFSKYRIDFNYAPHFELFHHKLVVQPGIQFSYIQNKVDWSKLTFGDMIDERQGFVYNTTEVPSPSKKSNFDLSAGLLLYSDHFFGGMSYDHLTRPNVGMFGYSELPLKFTTHIGANLTFGKKLPATFILSPTLLYMRQREFEMWLPGITAKYRFISLGVSYRSHDAFITTLAFQNRFLRVGYSYDYTTSLLLNKNTGGAHEIGLTWFLNLPKKYSGLKTLRLI